MRWLQVAGTLSQCRSAGAVRLAQHLQTSRPWFAARPRHVPREGSRAHTRPVWLTVGWIVMIPASFAAAGSRAWPTSQRCDCGRLCPATGLPGRPRASRSHRNKMRNAAPAKTCPRSSSSTSLPRRSRLRLGQVGTCIPGDSRISRNPPSQRARPCDRLIPGNGSQRRGPRLQHRKQGRHSRGSSTCGRRSALARPAADPLPAPQRRGTCSAEAESPRRAG